MNPKQNINIWIVSYFGFHAIGKETIYGVYDVKQGESFVGTHHRPVLEVFLIEFGYAVRALY